MWRRKLIALSIILFVTTIFGCSFRSKKMDVSISDFVSYTNTHVEVHPKMPNIADLALEERLNLVITDFNDDSLPNDQRHCAQFVTAEMYSMFSKKKFINLIDRNVTHKVRDEIALAEMRGYGSYAGPDVAGYAIVGQITDCTFTGKYSGNDFGNIAFSILALQQGARSANRIITGRYRYNAYVKGVLRVLQIPSLVELDRIHFSGHASQTESGESDSMKLLDQGLLATAVSNALVDIKDDIFSHIAITGRITQRRDIVGNSNSPAIFKINLGRKDGISPGDIVKLKLVVHELNELTEKEEESTEWVEVGIISDRITSNFAWIKVADISMANRVRIGDIISVTSSVN